MRLNYAVQIFLNLLAVSGGIFVIGLSCVAVVCVFLFMVGATKRSD